MCIEWNIMKLEMQTKINVILYWKEPLDFFFFFIWNKMLLFGSINQFIIYIFRLQSK